MSSDPSETTFLVVNLFTWMEPLDRHDIEDEIGEALEAEGVGEVTGGGGFVEPPEDGPACNIDIDATDVDRAVAVIRAVLRRLKVDPRTEVVVTEPEERVYLVYDEPGLA